MTASSCIIAAVDRDDPRPLWYSDWGTDKGAGTVNLKRALDSVLQERGPEGYAKFKDRLRLSLAGPVRRPHDQAWRRRSSSGWTRSGRRGTASGGTTASPR